MQNSHETKLKLKLYWAKYTQAAKPATHSAMESYKTMLNSSKFWVKLHEAKNTNYVIVYGY